MALRERFLPGTAAWRATVLVGAWGGGGNNWLADNNGTWVRLEGYPTSTIPAVVLGHNYGCEALFADGHVAFLKATMNYKTYLALSTRSGGETISNDY